MKRDDRRRDVRDNRDTDVLLPEYNEWHNVPDDPPENDVFREMNSAETDGRLAVWDRIDKSYIQSDEYVRLEEMR